MATDEKLVLFFEERATKIGSRPSIEELCYVSGKEPRLWTQPEMYDDMMNSITVQLDLSTSHSLLEVGCAAGLLALGLSQRCGQYTGIDLSQIAIKRASTLDIPNAKFQTADATAMPFADETFDKVICYDVFTNFPDFSLAQAILTEMLRVVKTGGKIMVGSIPDQATEKEYAKRVSEVAADLEQRFGALPKPPNRSNLFDRFKFWRLKKSKNVEPGVVCYYFNKKDFLEFGDSSKSSVVINEIHAKNPFRGFRFNAVYTKI